MTISEYTYLQFTCVAIGKLAQYPKLILAEFEDINDRATPCRLCGIIF